MKNLLLLICCCWMSGAWADSCIADVENESVKISGHQFYTTWRVRHNLGERQASVNFDYRIRYLNRRGVQLAENGFFNERMNGSGRQYVKSDTSLNDPVEVLGVEFSRVECRP